MDVLYNPVSEGKGLLRTYGIIVCINNKLFSQVANRPFSLGSSFAATDGGSPAYFYHVDDFH